MKIRRCTQKHSPFFSYFGWPQLPCKKKTNPKRCKEHTFQGQRDQLSTEMYHERDELNERLLTVIKR